MANLLYRISLTPTVPTSTTVKNAPLTNLEVDANFKSLNDQLSQLADGSFSYPANTTLSVNISGSAAQVANTLTRGTYLTGNNFNGSAATTWAVDATSASTASKVVARDASGNFSANIISAVDFNSTSDARLKTDIQDINGLDLIAQIDPVQFKWKDSGKLSYGVIAQQLETSLPELVIEREDGMKGVSYIPIIAMLLDAVKALDTRVKELESNK